MFRTVSGERSLWEAVLPEEVLMLPPVLVGADRLLGAPGLVEVFRPYFSADRGRWSIPMDTYVRMMFLKRRLRVGYERLCVEVAGSVTYRLAASSREMPSWLASDASQARTSPSS